MEPHNAIYTASVRVHVCRNCTNRSVEERFKDLHRPAQARGDVTALEEHLRAGWSPNAPNPMRLAKREPDA
ncbi:hypothetical protein GCM10010971_11110 [Silvimonas amylolytica]|uniref:Uncharacterized protein n=1 Tax=Silvimonas amylolytica TaxID=449663 RepID=A0ABQ2PII7_9NEIS|nr:hypothetical protein GCM10010971_11110 [Silvimonas amylolytica]